MINIFVGNLPYRITEQELEEMFTPFGEVGRANVVTNRETRESKGFGFVEMKYDKEGLHAIEQLDGTDIDGRTINVSIAKPR